MKKLLSFVVFAAMAMSVQAQEDWKMVITHSDGQKTEILTSDVKDIQYVKYIPNTPDANVDQIIIKEVYNGCSVLKSDTDCR